MIGLLLLPVLPLAVALWLACSRTAARTATGRVVALVALLPLAVAALAPSGHVEIPGLLILGSSGLRLDDSARAALLLFGGLWLTAGLLAARRGGPVGGIIAMLLTLAAALALAIAEGGPLVFTCLAATGYGLYAVAGSEGMTDWRRAGRAWIVLFVASDLLIFEVLLDAAAHPETRLGPVALFLGFAGLALRGGVPPAHVWLPAALQSVSPPVVLLLLAAPGAALLVGGPKLLPDGIGDLRDAGVVLAIAGSGWALLAGLAQRQPRQTLAYALAATAALLLLAVATGIGPAQTMPWLGLALLASFAAVPVAARGQGGRLRAILLVATLLVHGAAAGAVCRIATAGMSVGWVVFAALAAVAATLLLTVAARRMSQARHADATGEWLVFIPLGLAGAGLGLAWAAGPASFAGSWVAPVAVTLGWVIHRHVPDSGRSWMAPGDLLGPVGTLAGPGLRAIRAFCLEVLPRLAPLARASVLRAWDGPAWSRRVQHLEFSLRGWPVTWILLVAFALVSAWMLAR